jgi:hypothetical protein
MGAGVFALETVIELTQELRGLRLELSDLGDEHGRSSRIP